MSIEAQGRPWDQSLYTSIERKGGCHYKGPCSDYIELERKIQAHDLRYADRLEVYGSRTFNGMRITDSVVVLNGGHYMSTGIEKDEPITVRQHEHDEPARLHNEDDVKPTGIDPELPIDYELCERLGLTRAQCDEWRPGAGWSEAKPIDPKELRRVSVFFASRAEYHRREARFWAAVAAGCLLLVVGVMLIPSGWIWAAFEAFR